MSDDIEHSTGTGMGERISIDEGRSRLGSHAQEAHLDPWTIVSMPDGPSLFGYAPYHPITGGRAWTVTSPLMQLPYEADELTGISRARTQSRWYSLGRFISQQDLIEYHFEGLMALMLFQHPNEEGEEAEEIRLWLTARKMSRWLGHEEPGDIEPRAELEAYISRNRDAYLAARAISSQAAAQGELSTLSRRSPTL